MIIKEYMDEKTRIRIHNDYISEEKDKEVKEIIISLIMKRISE